MREVAFKVPEASKGRGGKRHTLRPSPGPLLQDGRLAGVFTSPHLGGEHLLSGEAPGASAHSRDGPACTPALLGSGNPVCPLQAPARTLQPLGL